MENNMPQVGKRYHFFQDGKSGASRHYICKITKIIPFAGITDEELLELYNTEVKYCYWLYEPTTDFFVYGQIVKPDNTLADDELIFVRTFDGWFSFNAGWGDGELDVDGSHYRAILKYWDAEQMGDYDWASGTKGLI